MLGDGMTYLETWEPARYFFDVTVLSETAAAAVWERVVGGNYFWTGGVQHLCWANPATFAFTTWYRDFCAMSQYYPSGGFEVATYALYRNYDFGLDMHLVEVEVSAKVWPDEWADRPFCYTLLSRVQLRMG